MKKLILLLFTIMIFSTSCVEKRDAYSIKEDLKIETLQILGGKISRDTGFNQDYEFHYVIIENIDYDFDFDFFKDTIVPYITKRAISNNFFISDRWGDERALLGYYKKYEITIRYNLFEDGITIFYMVKKT